MNKRRIVPSLAKPKFAMTGLAVGVCAGLLVGFIAEMTWHQSILVMQAGGLAGITVGGLFETARFLWRTRRYKKGLTTQSCKNA